MREVKLEKKLSPVNVLALAFGCIIGWGAFVMPGNTFLPKAGPLGTAIGMGIAILVMIVITFNYYFMINKFPVAGGGFTYAQNAFSKNHGFICAWFLSLSYATLVPMNATALALIGRNLLGDFFQKGFHYTVAGYDVYLGEILLAVAAIVLFAVLSIKGVKFAGTFQVLLTAALVFGVLIIAGAALISPKATVENLKPAFAPGTSMWSGVFAVLAVAPWAFVGFDTVPQAAEEFRFSPQKTKFIMVISILFGGMVYIVLNTVTASVVPEGYTGWADYIQNLNQIDGMKSLPTFNAAYELLGNVGLLFLGVAVLGAILSGIVGFYMATSRLLYSMAKENVIPQWFGKLHPEHKTPANAILALMCVSIIAPFFGRTALGWLVDMSSLGAAIGYTYTSAAAFKYAREIGDKVTMITGAIGTILAGVFAILLLIPIPALNCSLGKESYICLVAWIIVGIVFFKKSRK